MPDLARRFAAIIVAFAPLFRLRTWLHAEILLVGAILAPGKRTVTSICASLKMVQFYGLRSIERPEGWRVT